MNNINIITISGNVTKDPELKSVGGYDIVEFTVACHRKSKGEEIASFFNCKSFGQTSKILGDIAKKGSRIIVSGQIHQEFWLGSDGSKKSKFVVNVSSFEIIYLKKQDQEPVDYDTVQPKIEEIF